MLASLALLSLLQPATLGADGLSVANARFTYGKLGPVRGTAEFQPGDSLVLSFDISGITVDDTGKASYSTHMDVLDAAGKSLFKEPTKTRKFQNFLALGGSTLPAFAQLELGLDDSPPGNYIIAVTVTDNATQKTAVAKKDFTVGKKAFGLVRVNATGDHDGMLPIGALCAGQPFFINAAVVGYGVAGAKQPKVGVTLRVLDENGKPTLSKPFAGSFEKDVPADAKSLPVSFFVALNRPGSFTIELSATDGVLDGTSKVTYPITVYPHK
jgi:hypothetical protein